MKNKNLNCKECGNNEFVADSNKYDIFKVKEGKLKFQKEELFNGEVQLHCRECFKELEYEDSALEY